MTLLTELEPVEGYYWVYHHGELTIKKLSQGINFWYLGNTPLSHLASSKRFDNVLVQRIEEPEIPEHFDERKP